MFVYVAAPVSAEKADCLDHAHHGKDHGDRGGGLRGNGADKVFVRGVIECRHQHTDDGGDRKRDDETLDGCLRHAGVFVGVVLH